MSWWNSPDAVSLASSIARWAGAVIALIILILGHRLTTLQAVAKADEKQKTQAAIAEARALAQKLEERQAPWSVSEEKKAAFIALLRDAPKGKVAIEYIRSDEVRSRAFAEKLRDLLKEAGYDVWGYMAGFMQADAAPLTGIRVSIKNEHSDLVGGGLQRAFRALDLEAEGVRRHTQDATYADDFVVLYVGLKP